MKSNFPEFAGNGDETEDVDFEDDFESAGGAAGDVAGGGAGGKEQAEAEGRGHLPLLWLLLPIVAAYTVCFSADFHAPVLGVVLLLAGGAAGLTFAILRARKGAGAARFSWLNGAWMVAQCTAAFGLGLLLFARAVAPLVDWEKMPPREERLTLRWEHVFTGKPDAKTFSGIASVVEPPALLPELRDTLVYCQLRMPLAPLLRERGTTFSATGVLNTTRNELLRPRFFPKNTPPASLAFAPPPALPAPDVLPDVDSDAPPIGDADSDALPAADSDAPPVPVALPAVESPAAEPPPFDPTDFLRYLEGRRATIAFTRARAGEVIAPPNPVMLWAAQQGRRVEATLRAGLEPNAPAAVAIENLLPATWRPAWRERWSETADLFAGILLGRRVSRDTRQVFARTGTTHLFSVSGLHVGVIAALLFWLGRRFRAPDNTWRLVVIGVMLLFVLLTGASPAAMRAWFMASCMLAAHFFVRRGSAAAGLVLAATVSLLWSPMLWINVGFQLSYAVVTALVFYGLPLSEWVQERWRPYADLPERFRTRRQKFLVGAQKWLVGSLSISAAATLASAPLVVANFHLFSAGSLLANLIIVPLAFPVMLLGFASIALGLCWLGTLALPLNIVAGVNLVLLGSVARFASALPAMAWEFNYRASWHGGAVGLGIFVLLLTLPFGKNRPGWLFLVPPAVLFLSFL